MVGIQLAQHGVGDLGGRRVEGHPPVAQGHDALEVRTRHFHLVQGGDQRGTAGARCAHQGRDGLLRACRVEGRQGLVDQDQFRARHQRARQPHPLPFAARQAVDTLEQFVGHIEMRQRVARRVHALRVEQRAQAGPKPALRQPPRQHRGDDPLARRQRRHLRCEKQAPAQPVQGPSRQGPWLRVEQPNLALGRLQRTSHRVQQGGLAGTRRADDGHDLAALHTQRDGVNGEHVGAGGGMPHAELRELDVDQTSGQLEDGRVQDGRAKDGQEMGRCVYFSKPAFSAAALMPL